MHRDDSRYEMRDRYSSLSTDSRSAVTSGRPKTLVSYMRTGDKGGGVHVELLMHGPGDEKMLQSARFFESLIQHIRVRL